MLPSSTLSLRIITIHFSLHSCAPKTPFLSSLPLPSKATQRIPPTPLPSLNTYTPLHLHAPTVCLPVPPRGKLHTRNHKEEEEEEKKKCLSCWVWRANVSCVLYRSSLGKLSLTHIHPVTHILYTCYTEHYKLCSVLWLDLYVANVPYVHNSRLSNTPRQLHKHIRLCTGKQTIKLVCNVGST